MLLRSLYLIILLICPLSTYSQNGSGIIDTTDYLPYPSGLDYNLMIAASKGYTNEIIRLVKLGADIEAKTEEYVTPLMFAVVNNKYECVLELLSLGADPNIITHYTETPLLAAVKNSNLKIAEVLIRYNADINYKDAAGASPLHYASIYGNLSIADMLLYYNSLVDITANDGTTPLMAAVWVGYYDITDLLIQNGANVNRKDNEGFSAFLIAAQNGDTTIMSLLKDAGANIYETNNYNYNALALSIKENHITAVEYLLHEGNLWVLSTANSVNPFTVATKYSRKEIIEILSKAYPANQTHLSFDQASIAASSMITSHDFFTGLTIKIKEPLLNAGFIIGLDFKPLATKVIIKKNESLYYQYVDRRSVVYCGIFKDLNLTDSSLDNYWSLSVALSGAYSFGNHFDGTGISPERKLSIMPSVYLKWQTRKIDLFGGIDYSKSEFYKIGPLWLRLGCAFNIYFDSVRSPGKVIDWY